MYDCSLEYVESLKNSYIKTISLWKFGLKPLKMVFILVYIIIMLFDRPRDTSVVVQRR